MMNIKQRMTKIALKELNKAIRIEKRRVLRAETKLARAETKVYRLQIRDSKISLRLTNRIATINKNSEIQLKNIAARFDKRIARFS